MKMKKTSGDSQGGCERRFEVIVKMKITSGGGVRVDVI